MAESEKRKACVNGSEGREDGEGKVVEGVAVLDFEVLCSTVALQTEGKRLKLGEDEDFDGGEFGGVLRMWEGEVLDCFDDRRIAIEATCCPCYRFGKNMGRAGFGSCLVQGTASFFLATVALLNCIAFLVTRRPCFLYLAVAFVFSVATYMGFFRTQMKQKFNIRGSDSSMDDCIYHLMCPCCTLCQESRTLEMNNVQDGVWHGRGDTICIGSYGEGSKPLFELHPPPVASTGFPCPSNSMERGSNESDHSWVMEVGHSKPLVPPTQ